MSPLNPSGRLSRVDKGGKIFQIQTEFYHRPRRKITSTVILNGEIQNKVDTLWEEQLRTDEDLKKVEKALRKQHQRVAQSVENQMADVGKTQPEDPLLMKSGKKHSKVEGIENLVVMDDQGKVLYRRNALPQMKAMLEVLCPATRLASFLSQSTRLGNFLGGQLRLKNERMAWVCQKGKLWGALLNPKMDFDSFLEKINQIETEQLIE